MLTRPSKLKILCYHSVASDRRGAKWQVPLPHFVAQMRYLASRGVPVISLTRAVAELTSGAAPALSVVLTFDDGYADNFENAFPVTRDLGFPATLFVAANQVGVRGGDAPEGLPRMGWDELAACTARGVEIGVHSLTHRHLVGIDDAALASETVAAREVIAQRLGLPPAESFAYPYGSADARVRQAVREAGYSCAVSASSPRSCTAHTDPFDLRRETVYGDTPLWAFAAKLDPRWDSARALWWVPARGAIRIARRLLSSIGVGANVQACTSRSVREHRP